MARQNLRNVIQAISIEATALGEYLDGDEGAKFRNFYGNASSPILPARQKVADNMVGNGKPYPKKGKPYRFDPRNIPYSGALHSTMGVRIIRMFQGGTIGETTNTLPETIDSLIEMKDAGTVPMMANILRELGGEELLHGDVFVQSIEVSQQGDSEPQLTATLSNSGHLAKISDTDIDVADIESALAYLKCHGAKTKLTFSDGVDSYDLASEGRQLDVSLVANQNVIVEGLAGDPFYDVTNECLGAYAENVYIDVQDAMIRAKIYMDETFAEFDAWLADRTLTSVKLLFVSCEIIGATTHRFEIEFQFPFAEFNITPDQQGNFSAYSMEIKAIEGDNTTGSLMKVRVRSEDALDETV